MPVTIIIIIIIICVIVIVIVIAIIIVGMGPAQAIIRGWISIPWVFSILRTGRWFYESTCLACFTSVVEVFTDSANGFLGFLEWVSRAPGFVPRIGISSSFVPSPWGIICYIPGMFNRVAFSLRIEDSQQYIFNSIFAILYYE